MQGFFQNTGAKLQNLPCIHDSHGIAQGTGQRQIMCDDQHTLYSILTQ